MTQELKASIAVATDSIIMIEKVKSSVFSIISFSTNDSLISEKLPVVVDLISETFKLSPSENSILSELYTAPSFIKNRNEKIYIEKGKISIFYCIYKKEIFEKYMDCKVF